MANCITCKYAYIEDIWNEWDCMKSKRMNRDDGWIEDREFDCSAYEDMKDEPFPIYID